VPLWQLKIRNRKQCSAIMCEMWIIFFLIFVYLQKTYLEKNNFQFLDFYAFLTAVSGLTFTLCWAENNSFFVGDKFPFLFKGIIFHLNIFLKFSFSPYHLHLTAVNIFHTFFQLGRTKYAYTLHSHVQFCLFE